MGRSGEKNKVKVSNAGIKTRFGILGRANKTPAPGIKFRPDIAYDARTFYIPYDQQHLYQETDGIEEYLEKLDPKIYQISFNDKKERFPELYVETGTISGAISLDQKRNGQEIKAEYPFEITTPPRGPDKGLSFSVTIGEAGINPTLDGSDLAKRNEEPVGIVLIKTFDSEEEARKFLEEEGPEIIRNHEARILEANQRRREVAAITKKERQRLEEQGVDLSQVVFNLNTNYTTTATTNLDKVLKLGVSRWSSDDHHAVEGQVFPAGYGREVGNIEVIDLGKGYKAVAVAVHSDSPATTGETSNGGTVTVWHSSEEVVILDPDGKFVNRHSQRIAPKFIGKDHTLEKNNREQIREGLISEVKAKDYTRMYRPNKS